MRDTFNPRKAGGTVTAGALAHCANTASAALIVPFFAPLGLLSNSAVRRALLAVVVLGISFPVGRQFGYNEHAGSYGSIGGLPVTLGTIALIGLYVPLLLARRRPASGGNGLLSRPGFPLALYFAFAASSLLAAEDTILASYELFLIFQLVLLHHYIVTWAASEKDVLFVLRLLLAGLAVQALLMIGLATAPGTLSRLGPVTTIEDMVEDVWVTRYIQIALVKSRVDENGVTGAVRVGGSVGSPNDAGGYLSILLAVAVGMIMGSVGRRDRALSTLALLLGGAALIFTLSRGGWLAAALSMALLAAASLRAGFVSRRTLMVLAVFVVLLGAVFYRSIASRLTGDDEGSALSRVGLVKLAALIIEDHPLLGVGANNFPLAMEPYLTRGFAGQFIYTVHNKYLLVWSETGLGALLAFLWFLFAALWRGFRCWRARHPVFSPLAFGCAAGLAGHMIHMSVDVFRGPSTMQVVVLVSALIAVLERLSAAHSRGFPHAARAGEARLSAVAAGVRER